VFIGYIPDVRVVFLTTIYFADELSPAALGSIYAQTM